MEAEINPGAEAGIILLLPAAGGTKALPSEAVPATKAQSSSSATMAANLVPATGAVAYTKTGPSEAVPATKAPSSSSATMAANLVPATGAVAHTKAGPSEAALFWVSGTSPLAGSRGWMAGPSFLNPEQLNLAPPSSPERANHLYKTRLCVYDRENCPDGENCEFAHSEAEIRLPTRLIDGVCRYGEGCPYGARCFYRYH